MVCSELFESEEITVKEALYFLILLGHILLVQFILNCFSLSEFKEFFFFWLKKDPFSPILYFDVSVMLLFKTAALEIYFDAFPKFGFIFFIFGLE